MNCADIKKNEMHEKYILGRLNAEERKDYRRHLEQCAACQAELEREKELIAVIRAQAKRDMKREIKTQAEKLRRQKPSPDWTVWYKAAAVILLFSIMPALMYYYFRAGKTDTPEAIAPVRPAEERVQTAQPVTPVKENYPSESVTDDKIYTPEGAPAREKAGQAASAKSSLRVMERPSPANPSSLNAGAAASKTKKGKRPAEAPVSGFGETTVPLLSAEAVRGRESVPPEKNPALGPLSDYPVVYHYAESSSTLNRSLKKASAQADKISAKRLLWIYRSDGLRIEIIPEGALADSLTTGSAIPEYLEYEIISMEERLLRMIWRGGGAYLKTAGIPPQIVRTMPDRLDVIFHNRKYRLDLNRRKGTAEGL